MTCGGRAVGSWRLSRSGSIGAAFGRLLGGCGRDGALTCGGLGWAKRGPHCHHRRWGKLRHQWRDRWRPYGSAAQPCLCACVYRPFY